MSRVILDILPSSNKHSEESLNQAIIAGRSVCLKSKYLEQVYNLLSELRFTFKYKAIHLTSRLYPSILVYYDSNL